MPTPARSRLPLVALWLTACVGPGDPAAGSSTPSTAGPSSASASAAGATVDPAMTRPPPDPSPTWIDRPRTHLLLLRHAADSPDAHVLPLRLAPDPPALLPALRMPALPRVDWPGHFVAVATHGGGERWAHASGRDGAWALVPRTVDADATPREVALGATIPAAMHMVGDVIHVGAGNTVSTVDLAADPPTVQRLHARPDMQHKAYDLFARDGEWLVAIDDEVVPFYADAFTLDPRGHATHRAGWALPGVINGHYDRAVLGRRGPGFDGTLWLVAGYGIMDGHGQDLAALAIRDHALQVKPDVVLNSTAMTDPPVLEEHVSRRTGRPETLASGSDYTPWTGLARLVPAEGPARLLLAAGARGLLLVPEGFGPTTRAEAIDVGGECADVLVDGSRVLVLVAGPAPALLELRPTARGLEPGSRLPLPEPHSAFVR